MHLTDETAKILSIVIGVLIVATLIWILADWYEFRKK